MRMALISKTAWLAHSQSSTPSYVKTVQSVPSVQEQPNRVQLSVAQESTKIKLDRGKH